MYAPCVLVAVQVLLVAELDEDELPDEDELLDDDELLDVLPSTTATLSDESSLPQPPRNRNTGRTTATALPRSLFTCDCI